ncbi:hypothetical protein [Psychrobacter immobilis]|uniref:hypothetical protein n=1 Tax=Psychrobacter immobilis TaxID=498 RepID=UPI0019185B2D|nr:hypothetical protein [Psychrobacter immobilis]
MFKEQKFVIKQTKKDRSELEFNEVVLEIPDENDWFFIGAVIYKYQGVENKLRLLFTLYETSGGSYVCTKYTEKGIAVREGWLEAAVINTPSDLTTICGMTNAAKEFYTELSRKYPYLAAGLLGQYMTVID